VHQEKRRYRAPARNAELVAVGSADVAVNVVGSPLAALLAASLAAQ